MQQHNNWLGYRFSFKNCGSFLYLSITFALSSSTPEQSLSVAERPCLIKFLKKFLKAAQPSPYLCSMLGGIFGVH
jgi:hypothetical protein